MKKPLFILLSLVVLSSLLLAACGGAAEEPAANEAAKVERAAPPAEFAGKTLPAGADAAAGKTAYQTNCASCHGDSGAGDGAAAASLNPKPEPLSTNEESLSDAYLYWRISEGGQMDPFNSAMPAWKTILNEEQIWQVVAHIRSLD